MALDPDHHRLDLGPRPKDRGRDPGHNPGRSPSLHEHAGNAPRPRSRRSGEPLPHLALHHHDHRLDGGHVPQQIQYQRRSDVVGQIGHQHPPVRAPQDLTEIQGRSVALHDLDVSCPGLTDHRAQRSRKAGVDLHGPHRRTRLGQGESERAQPGTDLQHAVGRARAAESGDASHRVGINYEVLAEGPARRHVETVHERLQFRLRVSQEGSLFLQVGQGSQPFIS